MSSDKVDKYEYLAGEEIILSFNQRKIIEQAKLTYSPLGKAFEKRIKTIEDQGEKQVNALKSLKPKDQTKSIEGIFPKNQGSDEIKNELYKIKIYENRVISDNFSYESSKQVYDFKVFTKIMFLIMQEIFMRVKN